MSENLKNCHNYGCNKKYDQNLNDGIQDPCNYHPGDPFFHDAYKGWKCCQQKSTDFTTFLNFKPCKIGKHSDIRREKPKLEPITEKVIQKEVPQIQEVIVDEHQWTQLEIIEGKGVPEEDIIEEKKVSILCKKCGKSDSKEECVYHSGDVIFHETLKYYTCCPHKKFTDFSEFSSLIGCRRDSKHQMEIQLPKAREDWFQTENSVHIIVYGLKGSRSQHSIVETNQKILKIQMKDKTGNELFSREINLMGIINRNKSRVMISRSKVEIILEKVLKKFWNKLENN